MPLMDHVPYSICLYPSIRAEEELLFGTCYYCRGRKAEENWESQPGLLTLPLRIGTYYFAHFIG